MTERYQPLSRHGRALWLALGWFFVILGFIGALVPLMPTTIFLIFATGCFARSSPRLEAWLLDHPRFGRSLRAWRATGAIPRNAKLLAVGGMLLGYFAFWWGVGPALTSILQWGLFSQPVQASWSADRQHRERWRPVN